MPWCDFTPIWTPRIFLVLFFVGLVMVVQQDWILNSVWLSVLTFFFDNCFGIGILRVHRIFVGSRSYSQLLIKVTEFLTIIACMIEEQEHKIQALHIPELHPFVVVCQIHLSGLMSQRYCFFPDDIQACHS